MNRIYRLVWNAVQRAWVVTSELSRARGKIKSLYVVIALCCAICVMPAIGAVTLLKGSSYEWDATNGVTVDGVSTDKLSEITSSASLDSSGDIYNAISVLNHAISAYASNASDSNKLALESATTAYNSAVATSITSGTNFPIITFNDSTTLTASDAAADQRLGIGSNTFNLSITAGKTLTISGNNYSIYGGALQVGSGGVFNQSGEGSLAFNGNISALGGAIVNDDLVVLGDNTKFVKNSSTGRGGAIYNSGTGIITIGDGAEFTDNISSNRGGAIYNLGALTIGNNALFSNNSSGVNYGGALFSQGSLVLGDNATFSDNSGFNYGGAIAIEKGAAVLGNNSVFIGNKSGFGGAISNYNGTAILGDSASFSDNSVTSYGGAIYNTDSLTVGSVSVFANNHASDLAGAIYNSGIATLGAGTIFDGNNSTNSGGAIYNTGIVNFDTSSSSGATQFYGNTANKVLNSIYIANGALNISGDGTLDMLDPMTGTTATLSQSGGSTWYLAGTNSFTTSAAFSVSDKSTLYLYGTGQESMSGVTDSDGNAATAESAGVINLGTGSFTLDGTSTLASGGNGTSITVSTIALADGATLAFDAANYDSTSGSPMLTLTSTGTFTVGNDLDVNLTSLGSEGTYDLLKVNGGSLSDATINLLVGKSSLNNIDYLQGLTGSINDDGTDYAVTVGYSWNSKALDSDTRNSLAHGTFTIVGGSDVAISNVFADRDDIVEDSNAYGWDGKSLTKAGVGTLILTGKNTYTGATTVSAGTLKTGVVDAFARTSGVTVADGATLNLGGNSQTVTTLTNKGTVLINDAGAGVLEKAVTLYGDMINSGLVVINNGATNAGQTLAVDGNWTGYGGTVSLGTVLGGDGSLTDKLAISGNASGTTYVSVANEGGTGAQTLEGIELITTGSFTADAFVQSGRVVAGSYEYHLQQGSASGANMNNWYLTSQNQDAHTYRPERGSYASNLQAAATMFNLRLKDRQGGSVYTDPVTGERYESSLWVRSVGGHTEGRISDGQSKYSANRMVFQLGGDVLNGSLGADDAWHLGLMGGYGKQYSNTHNNLSGYNSKGSVWGYSTGIYGTWYQNAKDKTGLYADSWLAWNWFDNSVKGDELAYEKYKSKGLTASLETGYVFHTGSYVTSGGMENNVYVTPQAQVLWSGVKADNHTEANGTKVEGRGSDNVQTRLGVRLSMTGQSRLDKGSVRQFEPFVEANWVYTAKGYGVKMGDSSAYLQGSRNVAELKTGVEGRVSENLSVWGSVAQQVGTDSYQDTQGMLGVKYAF